MRVLRAAERVATPWKNGGGLTREIAAWPPGAGFDNFEWRVSMAEVTADGPFSAFPGIDRILAVLEGSLRLTVKGRVHELTARGPPLSFPGDLPARGEVADGPVVDLNLMMRRGRSRCRLEVLDLQGARTLSAVGVTLVVSGGDVLVEGVGRLARYDALHFEASEAPVTFRSDTPTPIYVASFEAV